VKKANAPKAGGVFPFSYKEKFTGRLWKSLHFIRFFAILLGKCRKNEVFYGYW
jgi:hypothetical protein